MTDTTAGSTGQSRLRVIIAACIGSALDWYDFFLYGTAAALVFGDLFFPKSEPAHHRGFWGGFAPLGVSVGNLLAAGAFALVTTLPREDLMTWGWRLPFLASFLLILVGIFVRLRVAETPVFTEAVVARGKI